VKFQEEIGRKRRKQKGRSRSTSTSHNIDVAFWSRAVPWTRTSSNWKRGNGEKKGKLDVTSSEEWIFEEIRRKLAWSNEFAQQIAATRACRRRKKKDKSASSDFSSQDVGPGGCRIIASIEKTTTT